MGEREEERSGARLGKTRERERKGIFFANGPDRQFLRTQLGWQRRQQQQHRAARTSPSDDDVYACARGASRSDLLVGYAEREEERRGETSKRRRRDRRKREESAFSLWKLDQGEAQAIHWKGHKQTTSSRHQRENI